MKKTLFVGVFLLLGVFLVHSQDVRLKTSYTKIEEGGVGPDEFEFYFTDNWLLKTDLYSSKTEKYPVDMEDSFYDEQGNYCEIYSPSTYIKKNPLDFLNNKLGGILKMYKLTYNKRGGELLYITEKIKRYNSNFSSKYYITDLGKAIYYK